MWGLFVVRPLQAQLSKNHRKYKGFSEDMMTLENNNELLRIISDTIENNKNWIFIKHELFCLTFHGTILKNVSLLFYISRNWVVFINIFAARNVQLFCFWMTRVQSPAGCPLSSLMTGSISLRRCYSWSAATLMWNPHEMETL